MKTLEELYKEVLVSDELKNEFNETSKSKEAVEAWLKKHDCGATADELGAFLKEKIEGEMNDEEVESVAGGTKGNRVTYSFVTLGLGCACTAIISQRNTGDAIQCLDEHGDELGKSLDAPVN